MEVELDVESPRQGWGDMLADWAAFCRETMMCQEDQLFKVCARGAVVVLEK